MYHFEYNWNVGLELYNNLKTQEDWFGYCAVKGKQKLNGCKEIINVDVFGKKRFIC